MVGFGVWGSVVVQGMDKSCEYGTYAQVFQMLYLIITFATAFLYTILLLTMRESTRRFYREVHLISEDESER